MKSIIRPRWTATGPDPGPSSHNRSSIRRPKTGSTLTTSKTRPQGSAAGESGRASQRVSAASRSPVAEVSQAAPSAVTRAVWCRPSSPSRRNRKMSCGVSSRSHVVMTPDVPGVTTR
ncbi:hypothetical protein ASE09_05890 [Streptomyces sp. Root66D1]|nr:hypothetical protein ASD33_05885 [Streptomyces sp. Root1304]KRA89704.1 hypothetical protein ASE09_05890 [Streptomyces sp. Root66D1]